MFNRKKSTTRGYALDIGSREVKMVAYEKPADTNNITLLGVGRASIDSHSLEHGRIRDVSDITQAVNTAYLEAKCDDKQHMVTAGVSGVVIDTVCSEITERRDKAQKKIKPKEWNDWMQYITHRLDQEEYHSERQYKVDMEMAHSSLEDMTIDGKNVDHPVKETGEKMVFDIFTAYAPKDHLDGLKYATKYIQMSFNGAFHNQYAVARMVLDYYKYPSPSLILVDIGDSHTDICLIIEGHIVSILSFSIGGYSFSQTLMNTFDLSVDEADTLKAEYSQARLPRHITDKITDVLTDDIKLWLQGFEVALAEISSQISLPDRVVLYGGGASLLGMKEAIEYGNWYKSIGDQYKPKVSLFSPRMLTHVIDDTGVFNAPQYIPLLGLIHVGNHHRKDIHLHF